MAHLAAADQAADQAEVKAEVLQVEDAAPVVQAVVLDLAPAVAAVLRVAALQAADALLAAVAHLEVEGLPAEATQAPRSLTIQVPSKLGARP